MLLPIWKQQNRPSCFPAHAVPEMESALKVAGFEVLEHLARKQIDNPSAAVSETELWDIVVAVKQG